MKLTEIYKKKDTVISFEIFPPKRDEELANIDATLSELAMLNPDYISVTFGAGGTSNNNKTIDIAKKIKEEYKIEPVVHLTGLYYDVQEIDNFVKALCDAGVDNILALRGDINPNVPAKTDFPYASKLIEYIKATTGDRFCIAGGCYPENHPETANSIDEIRYAKNKVDAGADVLLSQLFFNNQYFYDYVTHCRMAGIEVPITPGIMPAINAKQIRRMVDLCGATLPDNTETIINRYKDNKDAMLDAGMAFATSQIIDLLAHGCDGVHLYIMNNPSVAKKLCNSIVNII